MIKIGKNLLKIKNKIYLLRYDSELMYRGFMIRLPKIVGFSLK